MCSERAIRFPGLAKPGVEQLVDAAALGTAVLALTEHGKKAGTAFWLVEMSRKILPASF